MFQFPEQTVVNRVLPKNKIYEKARPPKAVRDLFVSEVEQIVWRHKLAPDTLRIEPADGVLEIQVFEIVIRPNELSRRILETIDRAIPYPVFFRLTREKAVQHALAFKRPALDGSGQWVVGEYFRSIWMSPEPQLQPMPMVLNLKTLYDKMLTACIGYEPRKGETIESLVERDALIRQTRRTLDRLERRLRAEKQFNRKVEINAEIRTLRAVLTGLQKP